MCITIVYGIFNTFFIGFDYSSYDLTDVTVVSRGGSSVNHMGIGWNMHDKRWLVDKLLVYTHPSDSINNSHKPNT